MPWQSSLKAGYFGAVSGLLLTFMVIGNAYAATMQPPLNWSFCPPLKKPPLLSAPPGKIIAKADQMHMAKHIVHLIGSARITRNQQTLRANKIEYNETTHITIANTPITLESPQFWMQARQGHYNLLLGSGELRHVFYQFYGAHAQGRATKALLLNKNITIFHHVTYSTCPVGHEIWALSATTVHLNKKKDIGTAWNALLKFKGIPIFYAPYLTFPISSKRKSGLLPPQITQSSTSGFVYRQPIYWNIEPQADATFTPEIYGQRGVGLGADARYMNTKSYSVLQGNLLPHDQITNSSRWLIAFNQTASPWKNWHTNINYSRVSDDNYFTDIGNQFLMTNTSLLPQIATAGWQNQNLSFNAEMEKYQNLDPLLNADQTPYQMLPQINLKGWLPWRPLGLQFSGSAQWTRFIRAQSIGGQRLVFAPAITYPLGGTSWFLNQKLRYWIITDQLNRTTLSGEKTHPSVETPVYSMHGGLYFQRSASPKVLQTLEPQFYYLFVPYHNQQNLPIFDTIQSPFSYSQLFLDNRFSGYDRIGDANQISLALTTRFINTITGNEIFSASLGQIIYFSPQQVTLPGVRPSTRHHSDFAGRLFATISRHWTALSSLTYNPDNHAVDYAYGGLEYRYSRQYLVDLGYQFQKQNLNQINLSLTTPLATHWQFVASTDYSLLDDSLINAFAGVEYNSCCWAVQFMARRYATLTPGQYDNAFYVELVLKGLGSLGNSISNYIERNIPNYASTE